MGYSYTKTARDRDQGPEYQPFLRETVGNYTFGTPSKSSTSLPVSKLKQTISSAQNSSNVDPGNESAIYIDNTGHFVFVVFIHSNRRT